MSNLLCGDVGARELGLLGFLGIKCQATTATAITPKATPSLILDPTKLSAIREWKRWMTFGLDWSEEIEEDVLFCPYRRYARDWTSSRTQHS